MDIAASLGRLRLTRAMAWSERALQQNWARRQRQSDEERIREEFEEPAEQVASRGVAPFEFDTEMKRVADSLRLRDGLYRVDAFRGPMVRVPDVFAGLI
jgi:hypothetical protein